VFFEVVEFVGFSKIVAIQPQIHTDERR